MTARTMAAEGTPEQLPWWVVLLQGIAALIIGILLIASPGMTTLVIVQALGWYWFFSGIMSIVTIFLDSSGWGWKLVVGIIGILAGLSIIQHPLWSTVLVPTTLVWILGFQGVLMGIVMLVQAFQGQGWGAGILGIISIVFGLILLFNPMLAAIGLPWIVGIMAIAGGITSIVWAFRAR